MKKLLIVASTLLLVGCTFKQPMVNPQTGTKAQCTHFGFGLVGTPVSLHLHHQCIKYYEERGFIKAQEPRPTKP